MNQEKIGKYITDKRKLKKLTQIQLAEKLGVSDKTISRWETGKNMPDLSLFKPLCDELNITINEFLSGEDIKKENYEKKLEENVVNVINYNNKKNKKRGIITYIKGTLLLIFIIIFLMLLFKTIQGQGINFITYSKYNNSKKIMNYIYTKDYNNLTNLLNYDAMYSEYLLYNEEIQKENYITYTNEELKKFLNNKQTTNDLKDISTCGLTHYTKDCVINIQYGMNPKNVVHFSYGPYKTSIDLIYNYLCENGSCGHNSGLTLILK